MKKKCIECLKEFDEKDPYEYCPFCGGKICEVVKLQFNPSRKDSQECVLKFDGNEIECEEIEIATS